jgi:hypothetical protein
VPVACCFTGRVGRPRTTLGGRRCMTLHARVALRFGCCLTRGRTASRTTGSTPKHRERTPRQIDEKSTSPSKVMLIRRQRQRAGPELVRLGATGVVLEPCSRAVWRSCLMWLPSSRTSAEVSSKECLRRGAQRAQYGGADQPTLNPQPSSLKTILSLSRLLPLPPPPPPTPTPNLKP